MTTKQVLGAVQNFIGLRQALSTSFVQLSTRHEQRRHFLHHNKQVGADENSKNKTKCQLNEPLLLLLLHCQRKTEEIKEE